MRAKLKAARRAAGMTQQQLADKAGISRVYVANLEAAKYTPTITVAQNIANALGVTPNDLFGTDAS